MLLKEGTCGPTNMTLLLIALVDRKEVMQYIQISATGTAFQILSIIFVL